MSGRWNRKPLIGVLGNSVLPEGDPRELLAREIGAHLMRIGARVMCGGMGGAMEAVCRGAASAPEHTSGDVIAILPEGDPQDANPFVDTIIPTGIGLARNSIIAQADAVVGVGGGAGTLSEMAFAWQYDRLVIGLECEGWSGRLAGAALDERVRFPKVPEDRVYGAKTGEEVAELLQELLPVYARGLLWIKGEES